MGWLASRRRWRRCNEDQHGRVHRSGTGLCDRAAGPAGSLADRAGNGDRGRSAHRRDRRARGVVRRRRGLSPAVPVGAARRVAGQDARGDLPVTRRVLLITTWQTACGIAEHSAMLKEAVEAADPDIEVVPDALSLDPVMLDDARGINLVHLNYQAALHSRWTPERIRELRQLRLPVVVTYHDSGVPNSEHCQAVIDAADAAVVHEPFDDLPDGKTRYWRMGVPEWSPPLELLTTDSRPILGSLGFPFLW